MTGWSYAARSRSIRQVRAGCCYTASCYLTLLTDCVDRWDISHLSCADDCCSDCVRCVSADSSNAIVVIPVIMNHSYYCIKEGTDSFISFFHLKTLLLQFLSLSATKTTNLPSISTQPLMMTVPPSLARRTLRVDTPNVKVPLAV